MSKLRKKARFCHMYTAYQKKVDSFIYLNKIGKQKLAKANTADTDVCIICSVL